MSVQIIVKLRSERDAPSPADELAREFELALEPMHPRSEDRTLSTYFSADVPDERVEEVLGRLRASPAVEAAYVKPADELP